MTITLRRAMLLATTMTMLPMIAACSRSAPDPAPEESVTESRTVETPPAPPPLEAPPPLAAVNATAPEALAIPPEAPIAEDEQMREDADAVGMTARAARDEAMTPPDDDAATPTNATGAD